MTPQQLQNLLQETIEPSYPSKVSSSNTVSDEDLIQLFEQRNEEALVQTAQKYSHYCYEIAYQILKQREDCEEILNDTYLATWNSIPPNHPPSLKYYLGKICRNLSINRYHSSHRQKRTGNQYALALQELLPCIPSNNSLEKSIEYQELIHLINTFLRSLKKEDSSLFLLRYFYFKSIEELATILGVKKGTIKVRLHRIRKQLKQYLEKEGVIL